MAKFGRFVLLALFALVLYEQCMANVEQLVQVFETVVDLLAASDKASKLKVTDLTIIQRANQLVFRTVSLRNS